MDWQGKILIPTFSILHLYVCITLRLWGTRANNRSSSLSLKVMSQKVMMRFFPSSFRSSPHMATPNRYKYLQWLTISTIRRVLPTFSYGEKITKCIAGCMLVVWKWQRDRILGGRWLIDHKSALMPHLGPQPRDQYPQSTSVVVTGGRVAVRSRCTLIGLYTPDKGAESRHIR